VSDIEAILLGGDAAGSENGARASQAPRASPAVAPRLRTASCAPDRARAVLRRATRARSVRARGSAPGGAAGRRRARAARQPVEPRTENQRRYLDLIEKSRSCSASACRGTGKTFLAVASAVRALRSGTCRRLVITRPVVEAGERLGFLPGDVQAKLNPYLRRSTTRSTTSVDFEDVSRLEETGVIEVAPLAFMRGRTLSHAFAILDEARTRPSRR
jgi:phosphate starvation-inducible PhoH-like protein